MNFESFNNEENKNEELLKGINEHFEAIIDIAKDLGPEELSKLSLKERIQQIGQIYEPRTTKNVGEGVSEGVKENPLYTDHKMKSKKD